MASTSTSSVQKSFKYDVFLSFRGEDTRHNFVSHLYKALEQHGIQTYKDDKKIEKGETIDTQLIQSIEDSRFHIIVFSKNYASSSWCLDELVKIMECRTASEQTAYPVFYDVESTEIRKLSGAVKEAFKKHDNKEAAGKWRMALKEAADLAGWESKKTANGDESKLVQKIVDVIFKKKCSSSSSVDGNLVGMETRIEAVLSSLELDADDVRMIGIWGMGGGGKTTLARAVFERIFIRFDSKAFVENVREVSKSSLYGLNKLQQQILRSVLSNNDITVNSVHEGTNMMKTLLRGRKVLIVLDDVDDREQLEALAGEPNDWFKFGSRVIITTRDKQVMSPHEVKFIDVNMLSRAEAICLLSKNAFKREIPIEGYEELSGQVVKYAGGLPLTIKVLGAALYGQNKREWIDTLERLKTIPLKETLEKLELSYKNLDDDHKQIFLDVACLLKGWPKDDAIRALESCGFHARNGLRVLEQRSFITISENGELGMHDHIEEMGMDIVRRVEPNEPKRHSRLWIDEEIKDILANGSGTQATECIRLNARSLNFEILKNGLANMKKLRFLYVDSPYVTNFDEDSLHLPNALRSLSWDYYPFSSLPKTFQAKNHVGLVMDESDIEQLWKDGEEKSCLKLRFQNIYPFSSLLKIFQAKKAEEKPFLKLRFLKFRFSFYMRTLDLSVAPNLETLILEFCHKLVEVHFEVTPNLKELCIFRCYKLEKLHMPSECPKLVNLHLSNLKLIRTLDLSVAPNLETLILEDCRKLVEVHFQVTPNLKELRIYKCRRLEKLHMPAESPKLRSLDLSYLLELRTLHLGVTPNLKELRIHNCYRLEKLHMPAESPKLRSLDLSYLLELRTLHLGVTPNLKTLRVRDCGNLVELHIPAECLKLVDLNLKNCIQVAELPEEIGRLECLKELDITGTRIRRLPESNFRVKGLRIVGSRRLLESCGFTSEIKTSGYKTFTYI